MKNRNFHDLVDLLDFLTQEERTFYFSIIESLNNREIELLYHLTNDLSDKEVAEKMCVVHTSIANYKNRIGEKLDLKGRRCVTRFAIAHKEVFQKLLAILLLFSCQ